MLVFFNSNVFSKDFDQIFSDANKYYNSSRYLESIQLYENILAEGWESGNLYFNLVNWRRDCFAYSPFHFNLRVSCIK